MSSRAAFVDDSNETRLSGELVYAGATVDDVLTVQADGSIAAAPGGGSSAAISDVLICHGSAVLNTGNSWSFNFAPGDITIDGQRGTDLSVVDNGGGDAALRTAAGGDTAAMVYVNFDVVLDATHTEARFLSIGSGGPDAPDVSPPWGLDALIPLATNPNYAEMRTFQPSWGVAAGAFALNYMLYLYVYGGIGTDVITVNTLSMTAWKIGSLPA